MPAIQTVWPLGGTFITVAPCKPLVQGSVGLGRMTCVSRAKMMTTFSNRYRYRYVDRIRITGDRLNPYAILDQQIGAATDSARCSSF